MSLCHLRANKITDFTGTTWWTVCCQWCVYIWTMTNWSLTLLHWSTMSLEEWLCSYNFLYFITFLPRLILFLFYHFKQLSGWRLQSLCLLSAPQALVVNHARCLGRLSGLTLDMMVIISLSYISLMPLRLCELISQVCSFSTTSMVNVSISIYLNKICNIAHAFVCIWYVDDNETSAHLKLIFKAVVDFSDIHHFHG